MATSGIFRVLEGGAQSRRYSSAAARAEYSPALSAVSIEALRRRVKLFAGCSGSLFADTKKYLADNAAKTAEIIKKNTSKLTKSVSSDPPPAKGKKGESRKAAKGAPSKKAPG
jgi:hypothetical protein